MRVVIIIFVLLACAGTASAADDCPALRLDTAYTGALKKSRYFIAAKDDWIFQTKRDLITYFPFRYNIDTELVTLTQYFKRKGITLVLVLPPPRGMAASASLPADDPLVARYDVAVARVQYIKMLAALNAKGVYAVGDADLNAEEDYYLKADPHWTPAGATEMARHVAEFVKNLPAYAVVPKLEFTTDNFKKEKIKGEFYSSIEKICGDDMPMDVEAQTVMTTRTQPQDRDLKPESMPVPAITLVGTGNSTSSANFAGRMKEFLGADIYNAAVIDGGIEGAMLSYLGSREYKEHPPKILIWEIPSFFDLGSDSVKSMLRQLQPSVFRSCEKPLREQKDVKISYGIDVFGGLAYSAPTDQTYYMAFTFSKPMKDKFMIRIKYDDNSSEEVTILPARGLPKDGSDMGEGAPEDNSYFYAPKLVGRAKIRAVTFSGAGGVTVNSALCAFPGNQASQH